MASILRPGILLYVCYEDGTRCAVSVPSASTVARAKASFLRARRGAGHNLSIIDLYFRGERLDDRLPLLSYNLRRGDEVMAVVDTLQKVVDDVVARVHRDVMQDDWDHLIDRSKDDRELTGPYY